MAQITSGIRSILSHPKIYQTLQSAISKNSSDIIVNEYIRPQAGDLILDIGCGPGATVNILPENVNYVGIDLSKKYIDSAKANFGSKGTFINADVSNFDYENIGRPDIILLLGVLHHLSDDEIKNIFSEIIKIKKSSTKVITLDCCYTKSQSFLSRSIISFDRGQNVRSPEGYSSLLAPYVTTIKETIREDLLRIPYTNCILECSY